MNIQELQRKRAMLLSARMRFSPETRPVVETAIEKMVEQCMFINHSDEGLTLNELQRKGSLTFVDETNPISDTEFGKALERLAATGRVVVRQEDIRELSPGSSKRYKLSPTALEELKEIQRTSESRLAHTVDKLFRDAPGGARKYQDAFLMCLTTIFSRLGETYVRQIRQAVDGEGTVYMPDLLSIAREISVQIPHVDGQIFEEGVTTFFTDRDPDFDAIKWNLAQNHYVIKALGFDPSGRLLSREVFGNATFYLDTNVVIPAVEPLADHHKSFTTLRKGCEHIGVQLRVCQISLDELRRVVQNNRNTIAKIAEVIPAETAPKVRGVFFEIYRERKAHDEVVDFEHLYDGFDDASKTLTQGYGVEIIDDHWFTNRGGSDDIASLAFSIRERYKEMRRSKTRSAAIHDALLIEWVNQERTKSGEEIWIATLDMGLQGLRVRVGGKDITAKVITLPALLQWISPLAFPGDLAEGVADMFAEALNYQLLPQDTFFDLHDFLMFTEYDIETNKIPPEDVEGCIRYVKTCAPGLDPSDPKDLQIIGYEMRRFFADRQQQFTSEIARLEAENRRMKTEFSDELRRVQDKSADQLADKERELKGLSGQLDELERRGERTKIEHDERISMIQKSLHVLESKRFRNGTLLRLAILALIWLLIEWLIFALVVKQGEGSTVLQRVVNSQWLFWIVTATWVFAAMVVLGKQRIRSLGWPWTKILEE